MSESRKPEVFQNLSVHLTAAGFDPEEESDLWMVSAQEGQQRFCKGSVKALPGFLRSLWLTFDLQRLVADKTWHAAPFMILNSAPCWLCTTTVMIQILKDMGVTEYEPRVINQMLEFTYRYVTTIIEDAKIYASHAKKSAVDADDIKLAIQCRMDQSFTSPPPRDFLLEAARQKNQTPLPLIKPYTGPRLPPDRYCLTAPNYRLKSIQKKVCSSSSSQTPTLMTSDLSPLFPCRCRHPPAGYRCLASVSAPSPADPQHLPWVSSGEEPVEPVCSLTSNPSLWSSGTPSVQSVSSKVGTPVSLTGQRFTVQIPPPSQTATTKTTTAASPAVSNVLINPSLIGSKNILITTNMVAQNASGDALKRKLEDDDDYDAL
ncbi:hypothetical protein CCH79_00016166 [Gambusia affinis]|uniref:Transcription initiation factor TFIID subunit 9 n=1 Tax=Gambusia affinis TaxID=33528 RepID=A0A315VM82_GAMAF|nr:hypothetical protein CCH79_00016166 [Gambusia affinis]